MIEEDDSVDGDDGCGWVVREEWKCDWLGGRREGGWASGGHSGWGSGERNLLNKELGEKEVETGYMGGQPGHGRCGRGLIV